MKISAFNATCPFEIGDKVRVSVQVAIHQGVLPQKVEMVRTITDIACVHYTRNGTIEFLYEFDNSTRYEKIEILSSIKS